MQFQSDLEYIKNPPRFKQDTFEAFDVLAAIDEVIERTQTGHFMHNYQWEADLRILLNKLHDGVSAWCNIYCVLTRKKLMLALACWLGHVVSGRRVYLFPRPWVSSLRGDAG
jgi:hypothetical protein